VTVVEKDGVRIACTADGPAHAPALLCLNAIGTTHELWERQVEPLAQRYRVIRYDARGHGASPAPPGEYAIDDLARDALAVLDAHRVSTAHVCGLSLGGLTALWMAVHAPDRVSSLIAANTSARIGTEESWTERIALVRERGMQAVVELAVPRWFTPAFAELQPDTYRRFAAMVGACPTAGYLGCCAALRDADLRESLASITCPTLVIAGRHDTATPVEALQFINDRVPDSQMVTLDAAHLSNVERHAGFTAAVADFLDRR
jgi:3-oxoadipate enol-lactonase